MQFLAIKKHYRKRADGREHAQALYVRKNRKFGEVLEQRHISTKRPVLITGAHASGKSYWLDRLRKDAARVWASRAAEPLHLAAVRPLSAWTDTRQLELWWASRKNSDDDRHWSRLKAWERVDMLPEYLRETGAVLFVDDAHNLSGRKLKLVQDCVRAAGVWVMTAADEGRIAPGLRKDVLAAEPQTFRLGSEVAYDATPMLMWILIMAAMMAGSWELAAVLGGLKMLGSGRRAAKQN
ncbi:hypothetical protein SAMN02949497_3054 [Methylomagnum ishizawai]|uniref:AAA domain-containing protein n=1 Tax=Methylomagnum ishizawai TaxID=1760988 RepID=A0A1Y6CZQ2_9GAMM|nr:hypothetical protein [Methylomagnum ishizawai]SMF95680.1 hypothetical protein SAMN02949497_3054 [Methylomagnum ishizawai]